jgi:hypothetical protein
MRGNFRAITEFFDMGWDGFDEIILADDDFLMRFDDLYWREKYLELELVLLELFLTDPKDERNLILQGMLHLFVGSRIF